MTLGAVTGPQGAIYRKANHAQPWFDGTKAEVYPVYHVLAGLGIASGNRRLEAVSSAPSAIAALAHRSPEGTELWLANLTPEVQKVKLTGLKGAAEIHHLSDGNFQKLATTPDFLFRKGQATKKVSAVELGPYGVVRIRTA
jgi:hypothetical protein